MTSNVQADTEATELLMKLKPKPGEPRIVALVDGKMGFYMTPEASETWQRLFARLDEIAKSEGEARMCEIWDASMLAAHQRGLQ